MANRKEYIDKLTIQLREWDKEIDTLEAKAEKAKADAEADYQNQLQELRSKRLAVETRVKKIQNAGEDAWEDLKTGTEEAVDAMKKAMSSAISKFK